MRVCPLLFNREFTLSLRKESLPPRAMVAVESCVGARLDCRG
uniref:Uncharacterized protein n=1 Tax=Anguilla anguilla TaxID=7936 RepID=A0A0E9USQ5_ANGAN